MTSLNEQELLVGAQSYDLSSLAEIYDRYSPGLYRYAMRLLGNETQAEDCVADTFSRFLQALRADHGPQNHLQAYLYRIAHNWITDSYRRQPPPPLELDDSFPDDHTPLPEMLAENQALQQEVRCALRALTSEQRQVIVLRFLEGWSNNEIAAAAGKPVGAIKALQYRGLKMLQTILLKKTRDKNEKTT
jgi:RNA polymerase sigma-70 factor (ECF subfamily)